MKKFVILPHQNQLLLIRDFQEKLCNLLLKSEILCAPFFPVMIQSDFLSSLESAGEISKIKKIELEEISQQDLVKKEAKKGEIIFLNAKINEEKGKIALVQILADSNAKTFDEMKENINALYEKLFLRIKKISPFRLCEIEIETKNFSSKWEIKSEKWGKI